MSAGFEGQDTMFTARVPAWHGIGTVTPGVLTAKEALIAGGLDWKVSKVPLMNPSLPDQVIPNRFAMTRSTDKRVLGIVGSDYVPFQNYEAFEFFDNLVDSGDAKYETAGSLEDGARVWLTAEPPEGVGIDIGEEMKFYILLSTSHDGGRSIKVDVTPVRVVCQNTLNLAVNAAKRSWKVRHTDSASGKLQEARTALGLTFEYIEAFEDVARKLMAVPVSNTRFDSFMKRVATSIPVFTDHTVLSIKQLYLESPNIKGTPAAGNGWGVLNAVGEYFDWVRPRNDTTRLDSTLVGGTGAKTRDKVSAALLEMAR